MATVQSRTLVSDEQVLSLAAWVVAFEELFVALEGGAPASIGDAETGSTEVLELIGEVFGVGTTDEDFENPLMVDLFATARERAAQMVRNIAEGEDPPLTLYGTPYNEFGLLKKAEELERDAVLTREKGNVWATKDDESERDDG